MSHSKFDIKLEGIGKSTLLKEVTRSFLHSGSPSAMLHYIAEGIKTNIDECWIEEDKAFLIRLQKEVADMSTQWSRREDMYYADPANKDVM